MKDLHNWHWVIAAWWSEANENKHQSRLLETFRVVLLRKRIFLRRNEIKKLKHSSTSRQMFAKQQNLRACDEFFNYSNQRRKLFAAEMRKFSKQLLWKQKSFEKYLYWNHTGKKFPKSLSWKQNCWNCRKISH